MSLKSLCPFCGRPDFSEYFLAFFRSRPGKPNQREGQNEKLMNFAHFCEFWCFSLGKNKHDSHWTFVPECPCGKFMNWPFFGLVCRGHSWVLVSTFFSDPCYWVRGTCAFTPYQVRISDAALGDRTLFREGTPAFERGAGLRRRQNTNAHVEGFWAPESQGPGFSTPLLSILKPSLQPSPL